MPSVYIAPLLSPKKGCFGKKFELILDHTQFIGFPISLRKLSLSNSNSQNQITITSNSDDDLSTNKKKNSIQISAFNIVFVLDNLRVSDSQIKALEKIVQQLSIAYHREESRSNFLTNQIQILVSIRERWLKAQTEISLSTSTKPGLKAFFSSIIPKNKP